MLEIVGLTDEIIDDIYLMSFHDFLSTIKSGKIEILKAQFRAACYRLIDAEVEEINVYDVSTTFENGTVIIEKDSIIDTNVSNVLAFTCVECGFKTTDAFEIANHIWNNHKEIIDHIFTTPH